MRKDIEKLIGQVNVLAIKVSDKTEHDVFVNYSGHTNGLDVEIIINGYDKYIEYKRESIIHFYFGMATNRVIKDKLKYAIKFLEELL